MTAPPKPKVDPSYEKLACVFSNSETQENDYPVDGLCNYVIYSEFSMFATNVASKCRGFRIISILFLLLFESLVFREYQGCF